MNKKKNVTIVAIALIALVGVMGVTFAMFSYMRTGSKNSQLIVGDIYMKYNETDTVINISDMTPRSTKPSEYFEFTVEGKNTYTEKDIIYDINIMHGDTITSKERIKDEFLRFTLEVDKTGSGTFTPVVENASYIDFANGLRIAKDEIEAETNNKVTHTYRLYVWIDESVVIYGGDLTSADGDYSVSEWNNLYASVKVNVTGYFQEKQVLQNLYEIVRTGAESDSGIRFYEINGTDNGNGKFVRSTTTSDTYPIYYYRGNVDNNNVIFADKCWKIVRTTETGGTKMIYNGEIKTIYNGMEQNLFTIVTNTGGWTFDGTDNTWNATITSNDGAEISFKVPSGDGYTLEMTGTTGPSTGGSYYFYKDGTQVYEYGGGGGQELAYTHSYGTLTGDNVIKFAYQGSGTTESPITFKLKMANSSSEVLGTNCDNPGILTFITTQLWYPSSKSPAYVGYNYGTTAYEYSTANWISGAKFGSSYTWNGTSYTLVDATETTPNATHHYSCNATNSDATCSDLRYVYYMSESTKYYITLQNGKGVEDALKEMLSESTDTIKSPIHETINNWYNTNIKNSYGTYVEDTAWCNDRSIGSLGGWNPNGGALTGSSWTDYSLLFSSYTRYQNPTGTNGIQTTNSPVLTCSNPNDVMSVANRKLENPVALLTYDEANLAGLIYNLDNYSNYLLVGNYYWLLSPAYFDTVIASVGGVDGYYLNGSDVYNTYPGVRPALSLKHGTLVYDGDGTVANPYIVGTQG